MYQVMNNFFSNKIRCKSDVKLYIHNFIINVQICKYLFGLFNALPNFCMLFTKRDRLFLFSKHRVLQNSHCMNDKIKPETHKS